MNLLVPGDDCIYAAPGAIGHYLDVHSYCPPDEFCEAVLHCPDCDSLQYRQALRELIAPDWIKYLDGATISILNGKA